MHDRDIRRAQSVIVGTGFGRDLDGFAASPGGSGRTRDRIPGLTRPVSTMPNNVGTWRQQTSTWYVMYPFGKAWHCARAGPSLDAREATARQRCRC